MFCEIVLQKQAVPDSLYCCRTATDRTKHTFYVKADNIREWIVCQCEKKAVKKRAVKKRARLMTGHLLEQGTI
jgi:hypothetical protein